MKIYLAQHFYPFVLLKSEIVKHFLKQEKKNQNQNYSNFLKQFLHSVTHKQNGTAIQLWIRLSQSK